MVLIDSIHYIMDVELGSGILYKKKIVDLRKLSPSPQHSFFRSEKNVGSQQYCC